MRTSTVPCKWWPMVSVHAQPGSRANGRAAKRPSKISTSAGRPHAHINKPSRPESGQLAGRSILFNWGDEGGWAVGTLGEPNTSKKFKVNGVVANFRATYAADKSTSSHLLSLTAYATSADAEEESWVLLGPPEAAPLLLQSNEEPSPAQAAVQAAAPRSNRARTQPMACTATPATTDPSESAMALDLNGLSPMECASLMMRLSARMGGGSSSADAGLG